MLLTFLSGREVSNIYRIETILTSEGVEDVLEYWCGGYSIKKIGFRLVQDINISKFITQVANQVTFDIFGTMGLGLSLSWYIESFNTAMAPVQCLFLYTAIETLNHNFPKEKLINTHDKKPQKQLNSKQEKVQFIREEIKKLRQLYQENTVRDLDETGNDGSRNTNKNETKFESILQRIDQKCESLSNDVKDPDQESYNTFKHIIESILIHYKVPYKDLFPDLNIITVRNKLIHTGYYIEQNQATEFYLKLRSLFIRMVLSIVEYEGSYSESTLTAEYGIHKLTEILSV